MPALCPPWHALQAMLKPDVAPWRDEPQFCLKPDKVVPTRARIEGELHRRWENVLLYLVTGDASTSNKPLDTVIVFMQQVRPALTNSYCAVAAYGHLPRFWKSIDSVLLRSATYHGAD